MTRESITQAAQTAELLASSLRQALKTADPVVAILLMQELTAAVGLHLRLSDLASAMVPQ